MFSLNYKITTEKISRTNECKQNTFGKNNSHIFHFYWMQGNNEKYPEYRPACKYWNSHYNLTRTSMLRSFIRCLLLPDSIKFTSAPRSVNKTWSLQKLTRKSNSIKCITMRSEMLLPENDAQTMTDVRRSRQSTYIGTVCELVIPRSYCTFIEASYK